MTYQNFIIEDNIQIRTEEDIIKIKEEEEPVVVGLNSDELYHV